MRHPTQQATSLQSKKKKACSKQFIHHLAVFASVDHGSGGKTPERTPKNIEARAALDVG
jgi:hypothetical protein